MGYFSNVLLALVSIVSVSAFLNNNVLTTNDGYGVTWCPVPIVGTRCPDGSPFHYYRCCGDVSTECCFTPQMWLIAVLFIIVLLMIAGCIGGIVWGCRRAKE
jgi:hypothetical protein